MNPVTPKLLLINPAMRANGPAPPNTNGSTTLIPGDAEPVPSSGQRLPNAGGMATMEPLALAYVAALTPLHWDVRIVDEVMEDIPTDCEPDLVGLTSLTTTAPRAYELAHYYRALGVPVVMGGVHATLIPDEVAQYVDVVFQGEAEGTWPSLIRDFEAGELKPRYNGGPAILSGLPWPRRDLYHHRYFLQLISASRGCHYRCEFCTLWKLEAGHFRARPPEEVLDELEATTQRGIAGLWGKRPILFTDENVYADRDWALALFQEMVSRGFNRPYAIQASMSIADDVELLAALQRSGCMTVLIGFESVNEESLRLMRKGVNLKIGVAHYKEKIAKLHDSGLMSSGTFMFGNDGDEADIFERTVEFVLDSGIDVAHYALLTPTPGTDLYARLAREGRLLYTNFPADYVHYHSRRAVFRPLKMTPEQLEEGLVWATEAVGARSVAARRAWNTWRETGSPLYTVIAYRWNRSGLYRRIMQ